MDAAARQYYESALFAGRYYLALTKRSQRIQADFLARTIEANGDTAFGREHGFAGIRSPAEYQRMVPVRKYDALEAWIERAAAGEGAVLTAETPILFHRTSGTSGAAKKIPVTKSGWLTRYVNSPARWASLLEHHPEINERVDAALSMTISPPAATRTAGGFPWCFFSETNWADARFSRHPGGPGVRAPWATAPAEVADRGFYKLRLCAESQVRGILAWFPASVLHLADTLGTHGEAIVREIHDGTVCGRPSRPPNAERAAELERVLSVGTGFTLKEIWPDLSVVESWKTATSQFYIQQLHSCIGEGVDIFPAGYGSTESSLAMTLRPGLDATLLDVTCAFFEFLPIDENDPRALLPHELERGRDYAIVLTTMSGLYRYALGDVVRVHDYVNDVPLLEFRYREGVASSLLAEKLTEPQIASAIGAVIGALGAQTDSQATLCPVYGTTPYYVLLLEAGMDLAPRRVAALAAVLDRALEGNVNYAFHRSAAVIAPARVEIVSPGTFGSWRERECESRRVAAPQQKHRLLVDSRQCEELREISVRLCSPRAVYQQD